MSVVNFPFYGNAIYGAFINLPTGVPDGTLAVTLDTYSIWIYNANTATWGGVNDQPSSPVLAPNGTAALPSYSFASDPDTGMYRFAANTVGFSCAGATVGNVSATAWTLLGDLNPGTSNTSAIRAKGASLFLNYGSVATIQAAVANSVTDGSISVSGDNTTASTAGAGFIAYGRAHASKQNVFEIYNNGALSVKTTEGNSVVMGSAAIATNATEGFLYVATCAGAPSGTPVAQTGRVPLVFDSTDGRLYAYYGGAWKYAAVAT